MGSKIVVTRPSDTRRPPIGNDRPRAGHRADFFGRAYELRLLRVGLDRAATSCGTSFVVVGDPGIGKTWLGDRVASDAEARGFAVLRGTGAPDAGAPPCWPWRTIMRGCIALGLAAAAQHEVCEAWSAADACDHQDTLVFTQRRFHLFDRVAAGLAAMAVRQPLLVVLDDVDAADPDSLLLFHFATRELRQSAVMLLALLHTSTADAAGAHFPALQRDSTLLALQGLDVAGTAKLARHMTGRAEPGGAGEVLADDAIARLHGMTGGNPLLIRALAQSWYGPGGRAPTSDEVVLPFEVRDFVRARVRGLPPATMQLLAVAATIGHDFDLETLRLATEGTGPCVRDLTHALARRVVAPVDDAGRRWRFVSPLMRDVVYADLSPDERTRWHAVVAGALVDAYGLSPDHQQPEDAAAIVQVADHYHRASGAAPAWEATRYTVLAAHCHMEASAYADAVAQWCHALQLLDAARVGERVAGRDRCEVLLGLGSALRASGAPDEARRTFESAAAEAREHGDPELFARAAHGYAGDWIGYIELARPEDPNGVANPTLRALLHEALRLLPQRSRWRPVLQARLAAELYLVAPLDQRRAWIDEALDAARRCDFDVAYGRVLCAAHVAVWTPDNLAERRELAREVVSVGRRTREPAIEGAGLAYAVADELEKGDFAASSVAADGLRHLGARARLPGLAWSAAVYDAAQALLAGRFAEAETMARAARDGAAVPAEPAAVAHALQQVTVRLALGRVDKLRNALPLWAELARRHPRMTSFHSMLALVHAELAETAQSRRLIDELSEDRFACIARNNVWLQSMGELADAVWLCDDPRHAPVLYELLIPFAERVVVGLFNAVVAGSVARHLGQLAALCGRVDDAERHFRTAVARNRALGAWPLVAQTQYAWARTRLRSDAGDDEAIGLLRQASATAEELGMEVLRRRCAELESSSGAPVARATPGDDDFRGGGERSQEHAFRREGDYWTLSYAGRTVRLRHVVGLTHLATLLGRPHEDVPAVALASIEADGSERRDRWSGVEVLDVRARDAYRERLAELREALAEAQAQGPAERAEAVRGEIDALAAELARATGLGGRQRRMGSVAERVRVNVIRAIATAIARIRVQHPALGEHLDATVRTGTSCAYRPRGRPWPRWRL